VPFVDRPEQVMVEVARVLRPGGRWVFSVTHPIRWAFADDPGPGGLTATRNYFDRSPYRERDDAGEICYAEHHRTLGDRIRDIVNAGLALEALIEPEWPDLRDAAARLRITPGDGRLHRLVTLRCSPNANGYQSAHRLRGRTPCTSGLP
jgi:SAM-dependent methyltransferase